ncbi:MAG: response regulator [Magnetococcales bacterium]|nr:response regulator [Magnetococcales bacterium]
MDSKLATVLIVDDEKTNIDVLVGLLNDRYKTLVAKNGKQALKRATATPRPDIVLLDIMMPDMNGFEVCRRLKTDPSTMDIPVIYITGMDDPEDEKRGLQAGAVDFIRKPFSPNVVLARLETHLALQKQKARLIELNADKNRFLGMAAHDLRNPLNSICGLSDMLLNMELEQEEKHKFIGMINNVGNQMLTLINDLLDVSVIESGQFDLNLLLSNLSEVTASRINLIQFSADKKGITVNQSLADTPNFRFDPERMGQVIDNLLSNAIKFTPPDTTITVRTGVEGDRVFIQVVDQGLGIPDQERDKLFGAFQKLSTRPTAKERSTGLGLSIVKRIVDAHGGEISVENEPGQGACFTVSLSSEQENRSDHEQLHRNLSEKPRILLIDDDYALRFMYSKVCSDAGFEVVGEAEDGQEGVGLFHTLKPDIVLCDIEMPVLTGIDALKAILELDSGACVIMLTSVSDTAVWDECLLSGARYYVQKETPYVELAKKVKEAWLEHCRMLG